MGETTHFRRHRFLWRLFYWPVRLFMRLRINYRPRVGPVRATALIVSNHVTDLDPLLLALTVKDPVYFVASSHIFKNPRLAKLLVWAQAPIARVKGDSGGDTAMTTLRRLKKGFSVALFAEGNRTFNGVTGEIVASTAKLARISGASLVTHRFRGGYLTSPRWSGASLRRGLMTGEIVNVYPPEKLKAMKPDEIACLIREDIREDAWETQDERRIPFRGRNLAEHIERALCLCPVCGGLGTLESRGNAFSCTCGMAGVFTPEGYFEGEALPYRTVRDWDAWQTAELKKRAGTAGDAPIASDTEIELFEVTEDFTETLTGRGELAIFRDRLVCPGLTLPLDGISGMSLNGPQSLYLNVRGIHYALRSPAVRNLRKYLTLWRALTDPDRISDI